MLTRLLGRIFGTLPLDPDSKETPSSQVEQAPPPRVPQVLVPNLAAPIYIANPPAEDIPDPDVRSVYESCMTLAHVINESLQLANESKNAGTKVSRLRVARHKLDELKALIARFPVIRLPNLGAVEQTIADMDNKFIEAGFYAPTTTASHAATPVGIVSGQIGQMTPAEVARALGSEDLINGLEFFATHQLRTPLRILLRHGELHRDIHSPPPVIATERWQGGGVMHRKTWRESGVDIDEMPSTFASEIGTVSSYEYLPFLIAVRSVVERDGRASVRHDQLHDELGKANWSAFVHKLGGREVVLNTFFPPFVDTIKGLPREAACSLRAKGLKTPAAIRDAGDAELLAIKGIGPAKLRLIRTACSEAADPDEELQDFVCR